MSLPFNNFYVSHSGRMPKSTNYPQNFHSHGPCSYCFNPYHNLGNCPSWGQRSNFLYGRMNTNSSSSGFESNSNIYTPNWSNHFEFSGQALATGNYALQFHELHHFEFSHFNNPSSIPSSYDYPPKQSSLEETLKEFMQLTGQSIQEITDATMANTEAIARLDGQLGHLVAEFNIIEKEELQCQKMVRGQYMSDKDAFGNSYHEHVQATTTPGNEETVEEIFCELSLKDPLEERFDQFGGDLDLDKLVEDVETSDEPSLQEPLEDVLLNMSAI
jgi:hypothetical protein